MDLCSFFFSKVLHAFIYFNDLNMWQWHIECLKVCLRPTLQLHHLLLYNLHEYINVILFTYWKEIFFATLAFTVYTDKQNIKIIYLTSIPSINNLSKKNTERKNAEQGFIGHVLDIYSAYNTFYIFYISPIP